jgi:hypothetical protein
LDDDAHFVEVGSGSRHGPFAPLDPAASPERLGLPTAAAARPTRAASSLFRNRDYALLWVGQTLSQIGFQSSWVAYPLLVLAHTAPAPVSSSP